MRASEAKAICTAAEYALIREAAPPQIGAHSPSKLRGFVSRARRLRDKYRDLANRQRREARGKSAPRGANPAGRNENTLKKVKLFEQTLARFETKLKKLTAKPAAKVAGSAKPAAAKKASNAKVSKASRPSLAAAIRSRSGAGAIASSAGSAPASVVGARVDTSAVEAGRETALKATTRRSQASRHANILAGTANARIGGHAKGEHARVQAKRDAKNAKG